MREKFVRLQQISTILNLDSVRDLFIMMRHRSMTRNLTLAPQEEDVDEFYNGSGIAWKLNEAEARLVAGLRV